MTNNLVYDNLLVNQFEDFLINPKDYNLVVDFQKQVKSQEPQTAYNYKNFDLDDLNRLSQSGGIIGIFDYNELIAFGIYKSQLHGTFPGKNNFRLSIENKDKVGFLGFSLVHQNYRGQGLQKRLIYLRENEIQYLGSEKVIVSVNNQNPISKNNIINSGYNFHSTLFDKGQYYRDIYQKKLI